MRDLAAIRARFNDTDLEILASARRMFSAHEAEVPAAHASRDQIVASFRADVMAPYGLTEDDLYAYAVGVLGIVYGLAFGAA